MKNKLIKSLILASVIMVAATGCGKKTDNKKTKLDPDNPVSLTIWHYYNGKQQTVFDELVEEFNSTVGKEEGIYVEGYSQGSVADLEKAVNASLNGEVGSEKLPDIFSAYADSAYEAQKKGKLTNLAEYFTKEELDSYVDSYIEEGYLEGDDKLYLFPVAKSTEILMINKTDWEPFAETTGVTVEDLSTTEGITKAAEKYYEWTDSLTPDIPDDGKALYGRDSMSNYFIIGMKQMGTDIFEVTDGQVKFNLDKELIRRLWDNYYVPYVKGYFYSYGRFRSDDVRTGDILVYTGSISSSYYFPDSVESDDETYPIDYIACKSPLMEGGEEYRVQQGAGMAVTKSDEKHEYAACEFLKWFTAKEQNLEFVAESSYMPVLKEANTMEALDSIVTPKSAGINKKAYDCLKVVLTDFDKSTPYTTKNFDNGTKARKVLDYNLSDKAANDRAEIDEKVKQGMSRSEAVKDYITDEAFDEWYNDFCEALSESVK